MKFWFVILMAFFPALAFSQKQGDKGDSLFYKRAREVVDSFIHSKLGIENGTVDLNVYNQFKNWFDLNAEIQDDYNAVYHFDKKSGKWKYTVNREWKPFDGYAHDVALQVKALSIDTVKGFQAIDTTDKGKMVYKVSRKVSLWKDRQYVLPKRFADSILVRRQDIKYDKPKYRQIAKQSLEDKVKDTATYYFTTSATLTITLVADEKGHVKISRIESIADADSVFCQNDSDQDAVLDRDDRFEGYPGDFTAEGRPDYDLDGLPDDLEKNPPAGLMKDNCRVTFGGAGNQGCPLDYFLTKNSLDGYIGMNVNAAVINLPELTQLGYTDNSGNYATDVLQSKKGSLTNPGLRTGIHIGSSFTYYFGQRERNSGIAIGGNFTAFFADYQLSEPVVYTFKSFDGVDDYRRRITIDSLNERIRYNIFNFPVMFSSRWYIGKKDSTETKQRKSVINIKAGPSLMIFSTTSEYGTFISFEGLYQTGANGIIYTDRFVDGDSRNIYFTVDSIKRRNPNGTANDVFNDLRNANPNYDFADRNFFSGKEKNNARMTVGFNLEINIQRQITREWSVRLGAQGLYAPIPENKVKYIPINKTTDTFNSIYNSSAKSSYSAFGLNIGLVYNFN